VRRLVCVVCTAALAVACAASPGSSASPGTKAIPTASQGALLVFANWAPDLKAGNGPEPGYRPAFTGLTGHDIASASAVMDTTGTYWVVDIIFTARGRDLFKQLTRDNVAACLGHGVTDPNQICPQRHLGMWLDLTQTDLDSWDDPTYAARVSRPFDLTCLAHTTATAACPKLVSDPITLQEIDSGNTQIAVLAKQSAIGLASAINSTAHV
jgi:preprotein translocase subunit SecD